MLKNNKYLLFALFCLLLVFNVSALDSDKSTVRIDKPADGIKISGTELNIKGWFLSTNKNAEVQVLINDNDVTSQIKRVQREDAIRVYGKEYEAGNDFLAGYEGNVDISPFADGDIIITVNIIDSSNKNILTTIKKKVTLEKYKTTLRIDKPSSGNKIVGTNLFLKGWFLSTNKDSEVQVLINNNDVTSQIKRVQREDAIRVYGKEYETGNDFLAGYEGNIDVSNFLNGNLTIRVNVKDSKSGEILSFLERNITLEKYKSTLRLDKPSSGFTVNDTVLNLKGWFLSTDKDNHVEVLLNDKDVSENIKRVQREDAIKLYGDEYETGNDFLAGYEGSIDLTEFNDGKLDITVNIKKNNNGDILTSLKRTIYLKKTYKTTLRLDKPSSGLKVTGTSLNIKGWFLSTNKSSSVQVLINNNDVSNEITRVQREDAINAYGSLYDAKSGDLAGYEGNIDLSAYKDGTLNIKIYIKDDKTGEVLDFIDRKITLNKSYKTTARLDKPSSGLKVTGTTLNIKGWFLSTNKNTSVQTIINNNDVSNEITRVQREDAINAYGSLYDAKSGDLAGYEGNIDLSTYKDGTLNIKINIKDLNTNEILFTIERKIYLKKYDGIIHLEYPSKYNFSTSSNITIQGWEMSESENSIVKVYIDNLEIASSRMKRQDVLDAIKNYGGTLTNNEPGFYVSASLSGLSDGAHKVTVKLYSKYNDLLDQKTVSINVYSNIYFGIDVSSHQGNINWEAVSKTGIDFAIIRLGYGDNLTNPNQDDKQFYNNINGATKYNIPYGVYLYSYASRVHGPTAVNVDSKSSDSEAYHALRLLNSLNTDQKRNLKLPVYIDMEDNSTVYVGKPILTDIANNFCNIISGNGYKCGIYANKNWLNNYLDSNYLSSRYDIWLAHYTEATDYLGIYQIWQYSSAGRLSGIASNSVDLNKSFRKYW